MVRLFLVLSFCLGMNLQVSAEEKKVEGKPSVELPKFYVYHAADADPVALLKEKKTIGFRLDKDGKLPYHELFKGRQETSAVPSAHKKIWKEDIPRLYTQAPFNYGKEQILKMQREYVVHADFLPITFYGLVFVPEKEGDKIEILLVSKYREVPLGMITLAQFEDEGKTISFPIPGKPQNILHIYTSTPRGDITFRYLTAKRELEILKATGGTTLWSLFGGERDHPVEMLDVRGILSSEVEPLERKPVDRQALAEQK